MAERIERAQAHCALKRLNRGPWAVQKTGDQSLRHPGVGGIGVERQSPTNDAAGRGVIAGKGGDRVAAHP